MKLPTIDRTWIATMLARAARWPGALLRRWKLVLALGAGAMAFTLFGYFGLDYFVSKIASRDKIMAYGQMVVGNAMTSLDRMVRGKAALREQANAWTPMPTELQDLEINIVSLTAQPVRSMAMTQLAGGVLLVAGNHGSFVTFDPASLEHRPATIASPINVDEFKADPLWNTPGNNHNFFRINDILALPKGEGAYTLFASHFYFTKKCIEFRLSRTEIAVNGLDIRQKGEWTKMFTATPCFPLLTEFVEGAWAFSGHLSGGRMLDYDARHLLMSVGDQQVFEARGVDVSQDPKVTMGKILLVDKETGAARIFVMGERNSQGLIRDSKGRLWETEHGPRGGDELNLIHDGANLGWPIDTYGMNYDNRPWPGAAREGRHEHFQHPVYAWVPSFGISTLIEAPGDMFPNWAGDLLVGSLAGNTLFRVRLEGDDAVYAEPIRFSGHAVRDMEILPDRRIAILDNNFQIILIRNAVGFGKSKAYDRDAGVTPKIAARGMSRERAQLVARGAEIFSRTCNECHSLVGGAGVGPQLRDVAGRNVASEQGFTYSDALAKSGGSWNEGALARFIGAPESRGAVAMPNPGVDAAGARAVAAYLTELRRQDRRNGGRPKATPKDGA